MTVIGDNAFWGCKSLQSLTLPDGVTEIGSRAFYECDALENVVIPEGVTSVGWGAFAGCEALRSVVIPESVTSISEGAFKDCDQLEDIVIPPRRKPCSAWKEVFEFEGSGVLTFPRLTLSAVSERRTKQRLALGYCLAPERYEDPWAEEYRLFVQKNAKGLITLAEKLGLSAAAAFCRTLQKQ